MQWSRNRQLNPGFDEWISAVKSESSQVKFAAPRSATF